MAIITNPTYHKNKIIWIYSITNLCNGKIYVWQSIHIFKRWEYYKYSKSSKDNTPILYAIRKYWLDNFKFLIIEECSKEELNEKECFYIKEYRSTVKEVWYNLSIWGRKTTWIYKPSKKTLKKRSIALRWKKRSEEKKKKMSEAQNGRIISDEHKMKLRESNIGRKPWNKGLAMSEETKNKLRASKIWKPATWRNKKVIRWDWVIFNSLKDAAESISATYGGIIRVCNGKRKKIYGYSFKYL